jgi:hypothetical protein
MTVGEASQDLGVIRCAKKTKRNEYASEGDDWEIVSKKNKSIQFTPCTLQRKNAGDEGTKVA